MTPSELSRLYDAHSEPVFGFCMNLLRDREAAREVFQEAFLRLAKQGQLPEEKVRSWMYRTAHNLVIDRSRRAETRSLALGELAAEACGLFASHPDPDAHAYFTAIADAMLELPDDQRAVVHLKVWEDHSFAEIAVILQISPNTAASRYRYALDKLQQNLRSIYEEMR